MHKTAYEMRISDWSSDVCSSDLRHHPPRPHPLPRAPTLLSERPPDREREGMMWPRPHLQGSNMSMFPPLPFALSLFLSACKAVEGGRSFLSASQRKSGASTSSARPGLRVDRKSTRLNSSH